MGTQKPLQLFYCYARKDRALRDQLEAHLAVLRSSNIIATWHDEQIRPGEVWEQAINTHFNTADVILLLVSPDFLASDYCYSREMLRAVERHRANEARVIPVLLRPTYWDDTPFSTLQVLPSNAEPVTTWSNMDDAFRDISDRIRQVIHEITEIRDLTHVSAPSRNIPKTKIDVSQQVQLRKSLLSAFPTRQHLEMMVAYALNEDLLVITGSGSLELMVFELIRWAAAQGRLDELVIAALKQNPYNPELIRVAQQLGLGNYQPSTADFSRGEIVQNTPVSSSVTSKLEAGSFNSSFFYRNLGHILSFFRLYGSAVAAYEHASKLKTDDPHLYVNRGNALRGLKKFEEALAAYEEAIRLDPDLAVAYQNKGKTYQQMAQNSSRELKRRAQQSFKKAKDLGIE